MALFGVEEGVATALGVLEDEAELLLGLDGGAGGGLIVVKRRLNSLLMLATGVKRRVSGITPLRSSGHFVVRLPPWSQSR